MDTPIKSRKKAVGIFATILFTAILGFTLSNTVWLSQSLADTSKVTICHRVGGAEVTLRVADDGAYSGHIPNHADDTVGVCGSDTNSGVNTNSSSFGFDTPGTLMKDFRER